MLFNSVIRRDLLLLTVLLASCGGSGRAQASGQGPSAARFDSEGEAQMVELINQARAAHGLSPLENDTRLTNAARKHTELMVQQSTLAHQFPGEPLPQDRVAAEGLASDQQGENVDLNQTITGAHDALMRSPPHRANILNPEYNAVGVGVIRRGADIWVTEDFARRLPQLSEPQAEAAAQNAITQYQRAHGFPAPMHKPATQLRRLACDMALNDALDMAPASHLPGVHGVFAWTAGDPGKLPHGVDRVLGPALAGGYSLGACFAPSVSHPGGLYWLVMVSY
jgi:uncharacterized protein YkwD